MDDDPAALERERQARLTAEANLRTAQQLLGLGIWQMDLVTGRLEWSEGVYAMYGVSPDVFGHAFEDYVALVHPDDAAGMQANFASFDPQTQQHFEFSHRILRPDGHVVHVRGIGEVQEDDGHRIVTGVVQDVTAQVQAERERVAAMHLVRLANQAARLGGWRVSLATGRIAGTPEMAAIHEEPAGFMPSMEQALGYYPPADRARIKAVFEACVRDGQAFDEVAQLVTARGNRIWVRTIGEAQRDGDGKIIAIAGALQDISELVAAREQADQLSRRLAETLESISDALFTLDQQWRFTFLNSEAERLLGHSRDGLLGRRIWDLFPPTAGSTFEREYQSAVSERRTVRFIEYFPPLQRWFQVTAYPVPDGLAVYFRDYTERKQADEALRQSEERFRLVTRAANDVIWDWDLVQDTIWWSESLASRFGFEPAEFGPQSAAWADRIHPEDRARVLASVEQALAGGQENWNEEYRFLHADGRPVTVSDRGFIIRDETGRALRMLGSMIDVTERRELDERLRQAQKLEAVGQLTGGVAHDFNNLLTVILGNSELLAESLADQSRLRTLAEMTANAAQRGAELTSRLLAFARRQPLEPHVTDFNRLVAGMDALLRRTLPEDIELEVVRGGGLWTTEIDPGQVEVALLNLVINSRDAMVNGGRLTLETANASLDASYARAHPEAVPGQYVMISVSDTGHGMTREVTAQAFEPFFTTKQAGKGSGLGLSMVYGFVKQSGGHARIYSEPGQGTTVRLYFPRATVAGEPTEERRREPEPAGGPEHVLVVEDDELVREHVVMQLRALGYPVTGVESGLKALEVLRETPDIGLLFTDVVMPGGMNGRELAQAARLLRPDLPVLFTSGYTENAIVHHGRLDRGVSLLSKPYRRQELAAKVRQVLNAARATDLPRRPTPDRPRD